MFAFLSIVDAVTRSGSKKTAADAADDVATAASPDEVTQTSEVHLHLNDDDVTQASDGATSEIECARADDLRPSNDDDEGHDLQSALLASLTPTEALTPSTTPLRTARPDDEAHHVVQRVVKPVSLDKRRSLFGRGTRPLTATTTTARSPVATEIHADAPLAASPVRTATSDHSSARKRSAIPRPIQQRSSSTTSVVQRTPSKDCSTPAARRRVSSSYGSSLASSLASSPANTARYGYAATPVLPEVMEALPELQHLQQGQLQLQQPQDLHTAIYGGNGGELGSEAETTSDVASSRSVGPTTLHRRAWAAAGAGGPAAPIAAADKPRFVVRANQTDGKIRVEMSLAFRLNTTGTIRLRGEMPPPLQPRAVAVNGQQIWSAPALM